LEHLERDRIVRGYGPDIELASAGYPVLAFATLEIAQGRLDEVAAGLAAIPSVVEAHATTGPGDVHCRLAARSHDHLQEVLIEVSQIPGVARSTSVIALSRVVEHRSVELLQSTELKPANRAGVR
jgi:DNA-binding Lrp family transcriptional regulator